MPGQLRIMFGKLTKITDEETQLKSSLRHSAHLYSTPDNNLLFWFHAPVFKAPNRGLNSESHTWLPANPSHVWPQLCPFSQMFFLRLTSKYTMVCPLTANKTEPHCSHRRQSFHKPQAGASEGLLEIMLYLHHNQMRLMDTD